MSRWLYGLGTAVTAVLFIALLTHPLFAHSDDPKAKKMDPRYHGPGYRSGVDEPGPGGGFASEGVELLSWISLDEFSDPIFQEQANDCWGYVSPSGREYAIIGLTSGVGFVEITDPGLPELLEVVPAPDSIWHDIKVYQHYAYAVTEAEGGIVVIDMSQIDSGDVSVVNTITEGGSTSTHNVALNTDSGYLYRCGGSGNGLRIYDLADPANPDFVAEWELRYVHDAQIVTFTEGPYAGREIAFCCTGFSGGWVQPGIDILDVTDKQDIIHLGGGEYEYPDARYSHQGWLSADRQYFFLGDELDEGDTVSSTTTHVIDVSDLENPVIASTFTNGNPAVGHNMYTLGNTLFQANYSSGLRVFDVSDPLNGVEIAWFDTRPEDDDTDFSGMWSNYPYFPSGTIIGSDRQRGLFVFRLEGATPVPGDVDGDGDVDFSDLLALLSSWGPCPAPPLNCPADFDGSGSVDFTDLLTLLSSWS